VSLSTRPEESQLEVAGLCRLPSPRTTAEGGGDDAAQWGVLAGAIVVWAGPVHQLADVRTFGQISNLLLFAVALMLIACTSGVGKSRCDSSPASATSRRRPEMARCLSI